MTAGAWYLPSFRYLDVQVEVFSDKNTLDQFLFLQRLNRMISTLFGSVNGANARNVTLMLWDSTSSEHHRCILRTTSSYAPLVVPTIIITNIYSATDREISKLRQALTLLTTVGEIDIACQCLSDTPLLMCQTNGPNATSLEEEEAEES
jgi:hypothetical protein